MEIIQTQFTDDGSIPNSQRLLLFRTLVRRRYESCR